jgi:V-type H+-transporting ATPase subunit C
MKARSELDRPPQQTNYFIAGKLDVYVEQATRKVANYLGDVLEDQREKLLENLIANGMDLATYMTRFQWDMAKYPIKQSLKNLSDMIAKQVIKT